ncbi:polysaccharide biosynthesis protein [Exiguobacterium sp. RIT452]|uniref:polysaccharide biosynthesis protein n=1 Tax=Exiguobacterium TaxID=33986 RepID=UPI00047CE2D3|nr:MULTISPECIES: nucleoside-diphosphate sugar epimerase/dehydratase [Exiguobacterium]RJO98168.1 polysaccharide biosynthesis protein [Exiguobacterium sp. RIT452]
MQAPPLHQYRRHLKIGLLRLIDAAVIIAATVVTFYFFNPLNLTANFELVDAVEIALIQWVALTLVAHWMRFYQIIWRYASLRDLGVLLVVVVASSFVLLGLEYALFDFAVERAVFLQTGLVLNGILFVRLLIRGRHLELKRERTLGKRTLIIGAGASGQMITKELKQKKAHILNVVGLLDDLTELKGMMIHGVPVVGAIEQLECIIEEYKIEAVVLAIPSLSYPDRVALLNRIKQTKVEAHTLPMLVELASGKVSVNQIREVSIADLLGREPVELDITEIERSVSQATVLVTGAGGSIGSEICRQLAKFKPDHLILLGHGENSIYLIRRELEAVTDGITLHSVIADVQDADRMMDVMQRFKPDLVYHAAAHKHVPLMEDNPSEAVKNNVYGTRNVALAAEAAGVKRFVMISTDKAVNPTSVMGATKRIAEMVIQQIARNSETTFAVVRFGNVLGSRGSVIPLFKEQIANGGPITVTDPAMTRYFMTIPEASRLVIQASVLAEGGEVFVLDMGEPVNITTLARNLIHLSGFTEEQIPIVYSGIRKGEKLYEELLATEEVHEERVFDKILVGKTRPFGSIDPYLRDIALAIDDEQALRTYLLEATNRTGPIPETIPPAIRVARE